MFSKLCAVFMLGVLSTSASWNLQAKEIFSYYDINKLSASSSECKAVLDTFASSSADFTLCAVQHSRPIHACQLCVHQYMAVRDAHAQIMTAGSNDTKCKDLLINHDRLEVVETVYGNILFLWKKGSCDRCFDWSPAGSPTLSNDTTTFISYFNAAKDCINNHAEYNLPSNDTQQICKDCMEDYLTLNDFYQSLKSVKGESSDICMDVVDSMNATRSVWSDVLKCCKLRKTPELVFLCCTGIITAMPVLFYLLAKIFCERANKPKVLTQTRLVDSSFHCPSSAAR